MEISGGPVVDSYASWMYAGGDEKKEVIMLVIVISNQMFSIT